MTSFADIQPDALRRLLHSRGWRLVDESGPAGDTWVTDVDGSPAVLVPRASDVADPSFARLMASAIERVAWTAGSPVDALLAELRNPTALCDLFEVKVDDRFMGAGRVPLRDAPKLAQALYEVILNGARFEFLGARTRYSAFSADVAEAMSTIDMLAPRPGSFRLIAASAVPFQFSLTDTEPDDVARRTLASAMAALAATREATDSSVPEDPDALDRHVRKGMSLNLLKHLSALDNASGTLSIEFIATWRDSRAAPAVPSRVRFEGPQLSRLADLRTVLRRNAPVNRKIKGWVIGTGAEAAGLEVLPPGVVVVELREEGRTRRVQVELNPQQLYETRAGSTLLEATGTLEKLGGRWQLTGATDIVLQDVRSTKQNPPT